jgi:hypothetical protein
MNKSLFNITQERLSIEALVEQMEGELTPEMEESLKINEKDLSIKGESYIIMLEKMHAAIEFNKRYKEQAEANIKRIQKAKERLEKNLLDAAILFGEFEAGIHTVGTRKSESLVIVDKEKLDNKYKKVKITESWDIAGMKKDYKSGEQVPGVELQENKNLKIK